jgi:chemotaxis protein histidine kinase CheA
MPRTLLDFFAEEADDYLNKLRRALGTAGTPDAAELRRLARALRGSARMADQEAIARAASAVQAVADDLAAGRRHWGPYLRQTLETAVSEIRQMVKSVDSPPPDQAHRAEALARRLGESTNPPPPSPKDRERFRLFLGTELRGLASEIGDALSVLERDPRNRDPLKRLLRRIRPLRGIEGVDQTPAVGSAVSAVEEVILRIADTSATVGPGHLVLFRRAQQALEDVATELIRGQEPEVGEVGPGEIEDLKDQVLDVAGQREIMWVSDLFEDKPGPHLEACPMAELGAGSWEAFFALELTGSLDTGDRLRTEMTGGGEGVRRAGEELAFTFRTLRERAVTFGHPDLGRIARRAGAAVRAALEGPRWRLQTMGVEIGDTLTALRAYLQAESDDERRKSLERAEVTLQAVAQPAEERIVDIESLLYSPQDALTRAKELSQTVDGMLKVGDADASDVRATLQEALDLVERALDKTGLPE